MHTAPGLSQPSAPGGGRRLMALLMALLFLSACAPASKSEEKLRKEVQALKAQMTAMQEKLNQRPISAPPRRSARFPGAPPR